MKRPFPWTWALLALVPLLPLWRCVFLGEVIGPWDQISHFWPFEPQPLRGAWDVLHADSALQFYGWRDLVFKAWGSGQMPFWNPYQLCGAPLLANSQSAGFYPLHILMGVLHVPTGLAITLLAWFHLAWAGFGVRSLALRCGAQEVGASLGGALFALSAFVLGWLPLASVVTTVAWIPWVLSCGLWLFEKPTPKVSAALAGCIGMMALGGHVQFTFYGLLALMVVVLGRLVTAGRAQRPAGLTVGWGVVGVALGMGLAAIQMVPVLTFSKDSHRQSVAGEAGYAAYVAGAPKPFELAGIVYPGALGYPGRAEEGVEGPPYPQHWPASARIGASFAESALAIGPAALLLLAGLRKRRSWFVAGPVAVVGVVGLLLALGTPLDALLYFGVPGWSATGSPGRAGVLFVMAACAVAALGWPEEGEEAPSKPMLGAAVAGAVVTVVMLLSAKGLPLWGNPAQTVEPLVSARLVELLPTALLGLVLVGVFLWAHKAKMLPVAAGALLLAHLATQVTTIVPSGVVPSLRQGVTFESSQRYAFENNGWSLLFAAPNAKLPPDLATTLRVMDVGGYDSLMHRDTVALLHEIDGKDAAPEANGNMMFVKPGADQTKLAEAGVSALVVGKDATVAQLTDAPGLVSLANGSKPRYLDLRADGFDLGLIEATFGTVRFLNLPGWTVDGGGAPRLEVGGRWLSFSDASSSEPYLEFRYRPPGFDRGLFFTTMSVATLLALVLYKPRQRTLVETEPLPAV